jgi:hypothetical protein
LTSQGKDNYMLFIKCQSKTIRISNINIIIYDYESSIFSVAHDVKNTQYPTPHKLSVLKDIKLVLFNAYGAVRINSYILSY